MYLTLYYLREFGNSITSLPSKTIAPELYLKYNKDNDSITYIILPHHSKTLENKTFSFTINSDLSSIELTRLRYEIGYNDFYTILKYATAIEADAFVSKKESFIKVFDNANKNILFMLSLNSIEELENAMQIRKYFIEKMDSILEDQDSLLDLNKSTTSKKCDFQIVVKRYDDSTFCLGLKVGADKFYSVKNFADFFEDFEEENNVCFGKYLTLKLCPDSFTNRALELLQIIKKYVSYLDNDINIQPDDFVKIIKLYQGESVLIEKDKYKISDEEINPEVTLNEVGKYSFIPQFPITTKVIAGRKSGCAIDTIKHIITPLNFINPAQASLYSLGKTLNYNFDFVADLITEDFKNFTHKSVRLKINDKELLSLKINLFISLDLQKNIIFKTTYEYENKELTKSEVQALKKFDSLLFEYEIRLRELNLLENGKTKELETLNNVLVADYGRVREIANVYLSDEISKLKKTRLQNIQIKASNSKDWLSVQVSSADYSQEELKTILSAYKKKKKFILLRDNFVSLDNLDELNELATLDENFNLSKDMDNSEVPMYQIFKLATLESNKNFDISYDQEIKDIILSIKDFVSKEIDLSDSLKSILRPYQIDAVKWMKTLYDNKLSGILADDMGLGKSIEFISFRTLVKENAPTLIVCPKSLIYNWRNEFKKRDPNSTCFLIDGNKSTRLEEINKAKDSNGVIIVSYDSLRSDLEEFKKIHFSIVCLDEAQYIKNSFTKKSKAVKQLDASSRFALTGTPIENALTDLWSIFDFLMPSYLSSEDNFSKEYETGFKDDDQSLKTKLLAKITPFILRRSKDDVLVDLPPKTTEIINIAMSKKQSDLYNAYVLSTRASMDEDPKNKLAVLSALTRMRQICVDPSSFLENYDEVSPKLEYTTNLVQNAIESGHKVLIFSQFKTVLEHLQVLLNDIKISFAYICGDTKANERLTIAENFNKSKTTNVILVSLKAGGTGLNLHGADTVVHLDPWWNFAVEDQATDRAHRIGQTRPVTVYKLVAHDSIEEKVIELQESKKDLYEQVILNGVENITNITDEDIKFLLS